MYIITKKFQGENLFYQFSSDESDLHCVVTDTLDTCKKYTEEEMERLKHSHLLLLRGVKFHRLGFTIA